MDSNTKQEQFLQISESKSINKIDQDDDENDEEDEEFSKTLMDFVQSGFGNFKTHVQILGEHVANGQRTLAAGVYFIPGSDGEMGDISFRDLRTKPQVDTTRKLLPDKPSKPTAVLLWNNSVVKVGWSRRNSQKKNVTHYILQMHQESNKKSRETNEDAIEFKWKDIIVSKEENNGNSSSGSSIDNSSSSCFYEWVNPIEGYTYYFRIKACNEHGVSEASEVTSIRVPISVPHKSQSSSKPKPSKSSKNSSKRIDFSRSLPRNQLGRKNQKTRPSSTFTGEFDIASKSDTNDEPENPVFNKEEEEEEEEEELTTPSKLIADLAAAITTDPDQIPNLIYKATQLYNPLEYPELNYMIERANKFLERQKEQQSLEIINHLSDTLRKTVALLKKTNQGFENDLNSKEFAIFENNREISKNTCDKATRSDNNTEDGFIEQHYGKSPSTDNFMGMLELEKLESLLKMIMDLVGEDADSCTDSLEMSSITESDEEINSSDLKTCRAYLTKKSKKKFQSKMRFLRQHIELMKQSRMKMMQKKIEEEALEALEDAKSERDPDRLMECIEHIKELNLNPNENDVNLLNLMIFERSLRLRFLEAIENENVKLLSDLLQQAYSLEGYQLEEEIRKAEEILERKQQISLETSEKGIDFTKQVTVTLANKEPPSLLKASLVSPPMNEMVEPVTNVNRGGQISSLSFPLIRCQLVTVIGPLTVY